MADPFPPDIENAAYDWTARLLGVLERVLRLRIRLNGDPGVLEAGDIFVFNHFARVETFIPPYLIHRHTGAHCRTVAAAELVRSTGPLGRYLAALGAVPNDQEGLLAFLATEVIRGHRVVVFPEGGMVKDRRVLDEGGRYRVYSRTTRERRKQHTGAAVLALAVAAFRRTVRQAEAQGETERIEAWVERLGLPDPEALLADARRPTVIVPANITFYPMRVSENLLEWAAHRFVHGLSPRLAEEIRIEGNLLLRDTDMDVRLAPPIRVEAFLTPWDRALARIAATDPEGPQDFLGRASGIGRLWGRRRRRLSLRIRDRYMVAMYQAVTVNLCHLASRIVQRWVDAGETEVPADRFHRALYRAIKAVQAEPDVNRHESVDHPDEYAGLLRGSCPGLETFTTTASAAGLIERDEGSYRFSGKLCQEFGLDEIRLENPVAVYANEVAPLPGVRRAVDAALSALDRPDPLGWLRARFDDEERLYALERASFCRPDTDEITRVEGTKVPGEPYLLVPKAPRSPAVLLVHGFTASPAELRPFGERLASLGHPVLGIRLRGHGTSPWDLRERTWEEWLDSVRRGFEALREAWDRVAVVGFSAGGILALRLAADRPEGLDRVAAVAAPVRVRDRGMRLVPLVHGANVVAHTLGAPDLMRFHRSSPEHPEINYIHVPVKALYELGRLIDDTLDRLGDVACPVLLVQGSEDPTVDPESGEILYEHIPVRDKALVLIPSDRHGILREDIGDTQGRVIHFLGG
ncbi:alpha/beta fold hydrolase [Deferrisoma camini]|uniref:alpha/beta fold hydrolase n=1 Tax=Deferrisoma camini TaxID=1035120 RepID=UPI00046D41CA|nr:alpha/beta fold hydrolase [Deferrisoma camini]